MQNLYDLFFNALKDIENQNDPQRRGNFSFSAHGKSAATNLKFRLQRGTSLYGALEWVPVKDSLGAGDNGVLNTITDEDINNVKLQCDKVEVNPYWTERVIMLFKAMQSFGVVMPVFQVGGYHPSGSTQSGFALRVRGWLHNDEGVPLGEIALEVHVYRMTHYERMSVQMENAARQTKAVTDFVEVADRLPLNRAQIDEAARAAVPLGIAEDNKVKDVVVLGSGHDSLTGRARRPRPLNTGGIGHIPNS